MRKLRTDRKADPDKQNLSIGILVKIFSPWKARKEGWYLNKKGKKNYTYSGPNSLVLGELA